MPGSRPLTVRLERLQQELRSRHRKGKHRPVLLGAVELPQQQRGKPQQRPRGRKAARNRYGRWVALPRPAHTVAGKTAEQWQVSAVSMTMMAVTLKRSVVIAEERAAAAEARALIAEKEAAAAKAAAEGQSRVATQDSPAEAQERVFADLADLTERLGTCRRINARASVFGVSATTDTTSASLSIPEGCFLCGELECGCEAAEALSGTSSLAPD